MLCLQWLVVYFKSNLTQSPLSALVFLEPYAFSRAEHVLHGFASSSDWFIALIKNVCCDWPVVSLENKKCSNNHNKRTLQKWPNYPANFTTVSEHSDVSILLAPSLRQSKLSFRCSAFLPPEKQYTSDKDPNPLTPLKMASNFSCGFQHTIQFSQDWKRKRECELTVTSINPLPSAFFP